MEADGSFSVKFASPLPLDGVTGFSHAHCYMRTTNNCSEDISPDPYMSKNLADMFCAKAINANFTWNDVRRTTTLGIESLTSATTCSRHNRALRILDAVATQAFSNVFDAMSYVIKKSLATKTTYYALSGEGLELWALKLLFGAYAGMAANDADALKVAEPLDFGIFERVLKAGALQSPCGLYIRRRVGQMGDPLGRGYLSAETANKITGLHFGFAAFECELILDPAGLNFEAIRQQYFYRPSSIDLIGKKRSANIFMSGSTFGANEAARFWLLDARGE
jgi:hypothetical protein